jgi:hypothetical protein
MKRSERNALVEEVMDILDNIERDTTGGFRYPIFCQGVLFGWVYLKKMKFGKKYYMYEDSSNNVKAMVDSLGGETLTLIRKQMVRKVQAC